VPRWQALLALLAVSTGSVLIAAGPPGLAHLGALLLDNAGWLLIGLGAIALLSAIAPAGALLGPLVLILAGLVIVGWPRPEVWALSGGVITLGGGLFVIRSTRSAGSKHDPVMRRWTMLFRGTVPLKDSTCPDQLFLTAIAGGPLIADLGAADPPSADVMEVLITCWGGCVHLQVPKHWTVVGGRLAASTMIFVKGELDSKQLVPDRWKLNGSTLKALTQKNAAQSGEDSILVIVHVMGFGGAVTLTR
jgi:hypothetical protein